MRYARITAGKMILIIPEKVLLDYIPPEEIEEGIKRGKGYKRAELVEARENKRLDIYIDCSELD